MLFSIMNSMVLSGLDIIQYLTYFWATQRVKWGQKCPNIAHFLANDDWKLQICTNMLFRIRNSMVLSGFDKILYLTYFWATQGVKWGSKVPKYCPFPRK